MSNSDAPIADKRRRHAGSAWTKSEFRASVPYRNRFGVLAAMNLAANGSQVAIAEGGRPTGPPRKNSDLGSVPSVAGDGSGSLGSTAIRPAFPHEAGGVALSWSATVTSKPRSCSDRATHTPMTPPPTTTTDPDAVL